MSYNIWKALGVAPKLIVHTRQLLDKLKKIMIKINCLVCKEFSLGWRDVQIYTKCIWYENY